MTDSERDATNGVAADENGLEIALTFSYEPEAVTDDLFGISEETLFEAFEAALDATHIERSVEVSVLVTTDEGIRALNRDYRGKDEATDVLSFPLLDEPLVEAPDEELWQVVEDDGAEDAEDAEVEEEEDDLDDLDDLDDADVDDAADDTLDADELEDDDGEWPLHLGDIAIARETVIRQAERAGHSAAYEAAFLFVHGVLHLVGYDDHTDAGYRAMVVIQEAALARAGIARQADSQ